MAIRYTIPEISAITLLSSVSDSLMNRCVARNYGDNYENEGNLPLLKIPAAEPILADAQDWKARFETVMATFSSRVGQISNAALRRSIIAYDENTTAEEKAQCRQETEVLAILTGLEIDSAKSGVKPDLSQYLGGNQGRKSLFLRYKTIQQKSDSRKWYQPTKKGADGFLLRLRGLGNSAGSGIGYLQGRENQKAEMEVALGC